MRRTLLLDPQLREAIVEMVRNGTPPTVAAEAAGIHQDTYLRWMARGREAQRKTGRLTANEEAYLAFFQAIRACQHRAIRNVSDRLLEYAMGGTVKREVRRIVMNEDGVDEELVEREYHPPHPQSLQWWLERRARAAFAPVAPVNPNETAEEDAPEPSAADEDPGRVQDDLASILDRIAAKVRTPPRDPGGNGSAGV
jgi:hypothetical protein